MLQETFPAHEFTGNLQDLGSAEALPSSCWSACSARQLRHLKARILSEELERIARDFGYDAMRLETGNKQPESIALYAKAGFYRIPNFSPFENDRSAICFEKGI